MSNAIETIDNEMICFIIYCLNCIRHGRNATFERGLNEINNLSGRGNGIMGRTFLDNLRYCLNRSTGQSFLSWSKQARNTSAGVSALPVFLKTVSVKDTPSGRTLQCLGSTGMPRRKSVQDRLIQTE